MKIKRVAIYVTTFVLLLSLVAVVNAQYAQTLVAYAPIGNGSVTNPSGIIGSSPNGSYAQIYGGNAGDGGNIEVQMSASVPSGSPIYLYGYSASGYYSRIYVYVSNDGYSWALVNSGYINNNAAGWIYVGNAPITYRYIAVSGYDGTYGYSVNVYTDCINSP